MSNLPEAKDSEYPEGWREYRRLPQTTEMRPYRKGEDLDESISISEADLNNGHPKEGDMIARDSENPNDKWLIRWEYFQRHFHPEPMGGSKHNPPKVDRDGKYYKEHPR